MKNDAKTKRSIRMPAAYFLIWLGSLLYWEFYLRIGISGGMRPANLLLLVFLPAEALFLTVLSGAAGRHRIACCICNILPGILLSAYYISELCYFRLAGSLLPVGLMGLGGDAVEDFGWTMRNVILRTLLDLPFILLPVILIAFLSLKRTGSRAVSPEAETLPETEPVTGLDAIPVLDLDAESDKEESPAPSPDTVEQAEEKTESLPFLRGYALLLRPLCLALAVLLWLAGAFSLSFFGRGRDSAFYIYHSNLTDTDTSAERIGALATTVVELYILNFGKSDDLSETLTVEVNMDALQLTDKNSSAPAQDTSAVIAAPDAESEPEEALIGEAAEEKEPPRPWENAAIDFRSLSDMAEDDNTKALCDYFATRRSTATNDYTGLFEGYNLIYLCCESFSGYGIDPEITPVLYEMANNGIVLENFYNSFPNITTNGEYAFDTSLWPDVSRTAADCGSVSGSFPQSAGLYMPYGLGDLFTAEGVNCYAYHNYRGDYYMRDYSWMNLGYSADNTKFLGRGMVFSNPWPASDLEMMEQSVDDYIDDERFHAYYMTFSGHGPYTDANYMYRKNISRVKELADGRYKNDLCLGYFCGEYELELAMEYLTERLKEAGKLDRTVFVLIGDHFPYYLSDDAVKEYNGGELPDSLERCRSTCIIYNAGLEEPIRNDAYCCNVDILPTILNLFNIDFDSRLLMGTDVFSDGVHRARLYNGSFVTKYVSYDRPTGGKTWRPDAEQLTTDERDAYLEAMLDYTENEYAVSLGMMVNNFYFYVWKNAGILSEEEVAAEIAREEKGASIYQVRQEAERVKKEEAAAAKQAEQEAAENPEGKETQEAPAQQNGDAPAQAPEGQTPAPAEQQAPAQTPEEQAPAPAEQQAPAPEPEAPAPEPEAPAPAPEAAENPQ